MYQLFRCSNTLTAQLDLHIWFMWPDITVVSHRSSTVSIWPRGPAVSHMSQRASMFISTCANWCCRTETLHLHTSLPHCDPLTIKQDRSTSHVYSLMGKWFPKLYLHFLCNHFCMRWFLTVLVLLLTNQTAEWVFTCNIDIRCTSFISGLLRPISCH